MLLITDQDDLGDLLSVAFADLRDDPGTPPEAAAFANLAVYSRRSGNDARLLLSRDGFTAPRLVLVDALIRESKRSGPSTGDGKAAAGVLTWLEEKRPEVPVVVVSQSSIHRLDMRVLRRRNVAMWSLAPDVNESVTARLARALSRISTRSAPHQQRITVEVDRRSSRFRFSDGDYEFTTDPYAYSDPGAVTNLIDGCERFTPYDDARKVRHDWQNVLNQYGRDLYRLLLEDTLGPAVADVVPDSQGKAANDSADIELRFECDASDSQSPSLFSLPFEQANPDYRPESYLCTRIPMARRIRLPGSSTLARLDDRSVPTRPPGTRKILVLNASIGGNVTVYDEATAETVPLRLEHLESPEREADAIRAIVESAQNRSGVRHLKVISADDARGTAMRDLLEAHLKSGEYDIFHFSGHSVSLGKGGTFLILPGEGSRALAVSVRALGDWLAQGSCSLVVLSSCRGASLRTAAETMSAGALAVIGFRWDVDDRVCVEYFKRFYNAYLCDGKTLSESYHRACRDVQSMERGIPLWASAIAVVREGPARAPQPKRA
jgi:hypothetical protein